MHKHSALASALAAKASHDLLEVVLEVASLRLEICSPGAALSGYLFNDKETYQPIGG
jgi:hypothetical protein